MTRYLVAYYSWTGHTAKVAEALAARLSADLEEICEVKPRRGPLIFIRSALEAACRRPAAIRPSVRNVADYDVVVLGSPVWAQDMASPMRAFLLREKPSLKQVALFCTLGGAGGEEALGKMEALCGQPAFADLLVREAALKTNAWCKLVEDFARRIRALAEPEQTSEAA
jgi:flavodoxin